MTTYKEIFGKPVKSLSTDPTNTEAEGQIWYNSTSGSFKSVVVGEAWSSSAPIVSSRAPLSSFGTQTAGVIFGGTPPGGPEVLTEEYNGSGWSTGGNLNTGAFIMGGAGTQTAGLRFGGETPPGTITATTELYDGSAWTTATGTLNTATSNQGGVGTQTAAVNFAGYVGTNTNATEEWDGTSWTVANPMNTARRSIGSAGIQTAALAFTGFVGPDATAATEEYDGTSWTTTSNQPDAKYSQSGAGTQTAALASAGFSPAAPGNSNAAFFYDGSTWSTKPSMATARRNQSRYMGTAPAAIVAGGDLGPAFTTVTEEFNRSTSVITAGAWASGGNLGTTRNQGNVAGAQTAGLLFGGETPPGSVTGATEEYDGSTWTAGGTMGTARFDLGLGSAGTQTAALGAGGFSPGGRETATEEYDGSTWTAGGALPTGRYEHGIFGTQTAGVVHNGTIPGPSITNTTVEYNGSTWTAGGNTSVTGFARGGAGIISAGKAVGARTAPSTYTADVEDYDGTSWTAGVNFFRTIQGTATGGTQTATIVGNNPLASPSLYSATFDGTGWATAPSLATARQRLAGTTQLAIAASGSGSEEFTGETSANNFKTLTTS